MATYYVETYRAAYPQNGVHCRAIKAKDFSTDSLSPGMTAVFQVEMVRTAQEAIACVIEKAAGHSPCVRLMFGGKKSEQS